MPPQGESSSRLGPFKLGMVLVPEAQVNRNFNDVWIDLRNMVFPAVGTLGPERSLCYHLVCDKDQYLDMYGSEYGGGAYIGPFRSGPRLFLLDFDYATQGGNLWVIPRARFHGLYSGFRGLESDLVFMRMWEKWTATEPPLPPPKRSRVVTLLDL